MAAGAIRVGVGGWTFEPWRGSFFPAGLPHKQELAFASRRLTAIEINGTYYGAQKPESFARWHDESPEGFVFSVKGPRFTTNRRVLAEAGASVERFVTGGVTKLKRKLGPINWQFLPTKKFDPADFEAFLKLLPARHDGVALRHVVEVRHESFRTPVFIDLLRQYGVATVLTDKADFPSLPDVSAPFVYLRLMQAAEDCPTGYDSAALDLWAERARAYAAGSQPDGLDRVAPSAKGRARKRDVFVYFINGFKPRAPQAAMAFLDRFGRTATPLSLAERGRG